MTLFVVAYLAGMLTIASPCILPVLPFVLARAGQPFARGVLPMLGGMVATFGAVASLAAVGGAWAIHANEFGRGLALALLALFGLALLLPRAATALSRPAVALGQTLSRQAAAGGPTIAGSALLGVATGLLWAPCAGPILGVVLTGAALRGVNPQTTLLLLAYAGGAATSMALAVLAGGRVFAAMKRSLGLGERIRQGLGLAVLAGVAAIALGLDTGVLARLSVGGTYGVEQALLDRLDGNRGQSGNASTQVASNGQLPSSTDATRPFRSRYPVEGTLPSLAGATTWLNSAPLASEQLRGKVVLIDFWTYSCINCIRTFPYVHAWAEKYKDQGLVVIGVHSPEFAFEKNLDNVRKAVTDYGIDHPVAVDNDYRVWRAFDNSYWPAMYFVDAEGRIRHHQFGEGGYDESERVIQDLLAEANGAKSADRDLVALEATGAEAAPDLANLQSGESYLGYDKAAPFASVDRVAVDQPQAYAGASPGLDQWSLGGNWTVGAQAATVNEAGGTLAYRFRARDLHLVLGPTKDGKPVRFQVSVDGREPGSSHGSDTDAAGNGTVTATRLYQLVRQSGDVGPRTFEVRFLDPGAEAYAFTFG